MLKTNSTGFGLRLVIAAIAVLALVAACAPVPPSAATPLPTLDPDGPVSSDDPTPTPSEEPDPGEFIFDENAIIEELDILILESFPVQVNAMVRGHLPDGCTVVDRGESERVDDTFQVRIFTRRPAEAVCTDALVAFEHSVSLDVFGLPAGEYTVQAGSVSETFTLAVDNILPTEGLQIDCLFSAEGQPVYTDEVGGYCFSYPLGFEAIVPEGPVDVIVRGPQHDGEVRAELVVGTMRRAERSLDEIVAEITGAGTEGSTLEDRLEILLGEEPAVMLANLPGGEPNRLVISAHGDWVYTLTFQPPDLTDQTEISADVQRLYDQVIATWSWLE